MGYSDTIGTSELIDLLLSFVVLTVAFSMVGSGSIFSGGANTINALNPDNLIVVGIAVGTGFLLHELAHKFVAQRYGYRAEYKASIWGLALTFIMAVTIGIVFAAPGAVMIRKGPYSSPQSTYDYNPNDDSYWDHLERKAGNEDLWISLAGPVTNIILAAMFFSTLMSGVLSNIPLLENAAGYAIFINLMLAAFNLIPIDPLDGGKIFRGNAILWVVIAVPTILTALAIMFGQIHIYY
jgi:Zn-dependent protease